MVSTLMTAPNAGADQDAKGRSRLAHTIVVGNEKGGAGKSTLAIHIVCGLLHAGRRVAIIDLDLRQRSMSRFFANRAAWMTGNHQVLPMPVEPDLGDPLEPGRLPLPARGAAALETEDHIVEHRAVIEARVVLKHHPAIGPGTDDRPTEHRHAATRRRMLRLEPSHEPEYRALSAAARAEKRRDLAVAHDVGNREAHGRDRHVFPGRALTVDLGDVAKLHSGRPVGGWRGRRGRRRSRGSDIAHTAASVGPAAPCRILRSSFGRTPRPP